MDLPILHAPFDGLAELDAPFALLLAPGVEPAADAVEELVALAERDPSVGIVGARLVRGDSRLVHAGGIVSADGSVWSYGHGDDADDPRYLHVREVDWVSSECALVRVDAARAAGGFDPTFAGEQADADLGLALRRAGFRVVYDPFATAVVHERDVPAAEPDPACELSVVIPTRNRAELLRASLESLAAQTISHDRFEVVVVDDGSTDETGAVCAELAESVRLRHVAIPSSGIAAAKNAGVRAARGAIVCFFDDDDVADPGLLAEHLRVHAERPEEHVAVLGYTTWGDWLEVTPLMRFVTDVGHYLFAYDGLEDGQSLDYTYFWGGRSSCKRSFLLRHGLFNPTFTFGSEDIELGYRLSRHGLEVVFARNAVSLMNRAVTLDEFCRRVERQGRSQLWFSHLHADPAVQAWCGVADAESRWADAEPGLDADIARAQTLAHEGGDGFHALLWRVFDALKLKGIVEAAAEAEEAGEPPALRHATDRAALRAKWRDELRAQQAPEPALLRRAADRAPGRRILVADLLLPAYTRASGARRMFAMLRLLAAAGERVVFVAIDNSDDPRFVDELRRLGVETYPGDPDRAWLLKRPVEARTLDVGELLAETEPELVILSLWYVAEQYLEHVRRYAPRARVVVDTVDVHFLREQRQAELNRDPALARAAAETRLRELAACNAADAVIAVTEPDAEALRRELPGATVYVIPNIHDVTEDAPGPGGRAGLLFVGNFLHKPNPDAAVWLCEEIMPLVWAEEPETRVTIAGFRPTEEVLALAGSRVDVVGEVPAIEPYLESSRISVAPLRFGAGIKGKVCEALAAGLPVVTTSVGSEGLGFEAGRQVLLEADDPAGYAAHVVSLLRDDDLWRELADEGRAYVEEWLSPGVVGERLAALVAAEARLQADPELTSIVILVRDQPELTSACFASLAAHTPERHEIVFVDNGSATETAELLAGWTEEHEHVRVVRNSVNLGFAAGNNQGLALARGGTVVLLNNDTVVTDGWLAGLRAQLALPGVGIAGPVTNRISGPQQLADAVYETEEDLHAFAAARVAAHAGEGADVVRVVGFCMAVRREVLDRIGGLDERFGVGNFEDDDFSVRAAWAGWRARIALDSFVHHVGNQTFLAAGIDHHQAMLRNWGLYKAKWGIPPETSVSDDFEIAEGTLAATSQVVPLPPLGRFHEPSGRVWRESEASRVLAAAAGAIQTGRIDALREAFAEAARWVDRNRCYGTRRRLVEMVLGAPSRGDSDWMALFAAGAEELLTVLEEEPSEPILLNYAGVLLYELAEAKAAESLFRASLRLDPKNTQARENREQARRRRSGRTAGAPRGALAATVRALAARAKRVAARAKPAEGLTLSLCMIVKDEEEMLPGCLEAVRDGVDEIIVVDTGSADRTAEIAESFGAKVVHFPWNGSFADARNVSLDHATGDWILYLDADEHLADGEAQKLRTLLGRTWREAFNLVVVNYTGGSGSGEAVTHLALRMWRNRPEYHFHGRIHEQKTVPGYLPERIETTDVRVLHYGYLRARVSGREKSRRNIELLERELAEGPSAFASFNLGSEYMMLGDAERAREHLERAWEEVAPQRAWPGYASMLVSRLATVRRECGDLELARAAVAEGLERLPLHTDLVFVLALCAADEEDWSAAEEHARRCLEMGDAPPGYSGTVGMGSHLARALLGQLAERKGRFDEAETHYRTALAEYPDFAAPALSLATLALRRGASPAELETLLPLERPSVLLLAASACHEAGHSGIAADWFARVLEAEPDNGAARVGLVEALLAERRWDEAVEQARAREDAPAVEGKLAIAECFVHALRGDADALAGALDGSPIAGAERKLLDAWHGLLRSGELPDSLPEQALSPAATLLEALLKVQEFQAFETLHALYARIDAEAATRADVLAAIYFRCGYLDSAAEEWSAAFEAAPSAERLLGLARVAIAKGMPDDAAVLCDEALRLEPKHAEAAALRDALQRVAPPAADASAARAAAAEGEPLASIAILTLNGLPHTRACLDSIERCTPEPHELLLVDNGSDDGTAELLREYASGRPHVRVVLNAENRGFAGGNNQALALARGRYAVLLNNDTVVTDGWLGRLVAAAERTGAGLVGPVSNHVSGPQLVEAGYGSLEELEPFAAERAAAYAGRTRPAVRLVGFCLLVARGVLDAVGALDERFGTGNFEDDDLCLRARGAGFDCVIADDVFVHHTGHQTFLAAGIDYTATMQRNLAEFERKWGCTIADAITAGPAAVEPERMERLRHLPLPPAPSPVEPAPARQPAAGSAPAEPAQDAAERGEPRVERHLLRAREAVIRGDLETLRAGFVEPGDWDEPQRAYQAVRHLTELVLAAGEHLHGDAWIDPYIVAADGLLEVLEREPSEPVLLNTAGVFLHELTELEAAAALFEAALRLDPSLEDAPGNLAAAREPGRPRLPRSFPQLAERAQRVAARAKPAEGLTLSLCMIVKDEEEMLPGCLQAVRDGVDEIIVVDTGSTDRTVEIAESFGAEVVHFPWNGSFADARNISLDHATGDWILYLDADEHLADREAAKLRTLLGRTWREGFYLLETNYTGAEDAGTAVAHPALRVFRNRPEYRFEGRIHEQKTRRMPTYLPERFERTSVRVEHYGYLTTRVEARDKSRRNLELLEAEPPSPFASFNLGSEHQLLGDWERAATHFGEAWEALRREDEWQHAGFAPLLGLRLARSHRETERIDAAREVLAEALAHWPDYTDLSFELALCAQVAGEPQEAERLLRHCLEQGDADLRYAGTVGAGSHIALALLGELAEQRGDAGEAEALYRRSLAAQPAFARPVLPLAALLLRRGVHPAELGRELPLEHPPAALLAATACLEAGHAAEAETLLHHVLDRAPENDAARVALLEALLAQRRYDEAAARAAAEPPDSPVAAQAATAELFACAVAGDCDAVATALERAETTGVAEAELALYRGWATVLAGTPLPQRLPAEALEPALVVLEALLRVQEFVAFELLIPVYERIDVPAAPRRDRLADVYLRRGFVDSAEEEWLRGERDLSALVGLTQVALVREQSREAATRAAEALAHDPTSPVAQRLVEALT